jgi:uncharacterized protein (TIGR02246 family)
MWRMWCDAAIPLILATGETAMPKAYWIAHVTVTDAQAYEAYRSAIAAPLTRFGARFIVRGGSQSVVEGEMRPRTVVIEFPSLQAAADCYNSPEYQAAKALRAPVSAADICIVDGPISGVQIQTTIYHDKIHDMAKAYTAAWNSGSPDAVAGFYAEDGQIVINRGTPWLGRNGIAQMAAGFFADVPNLALVCDHVRIAGDHVVYLWTFTGNHSGTKNPLRIAGWEEWDMDEDLKIKASRGWFDADDYARQVAGAAASTENNRK